VAVARYLVADDIRYREIDGCGVILDISNQRYSVLDDLGTRMWACLTGESDTENWVRRWAKEYNVTADEIADTIDEFCADCVRKDFLRRWEPGGLAADGGRPALPGIYRHLPGWMVAFGALAFTALSLKFRGFAKTYGRRREIPAAGSSSIPASLEAVIRPFLFAENFVFFSRAPNDCLARSLAFFHYLRWRGVPAVHVIGVRRVPFMAHAWVEVSGEGVLGPRPRGFVTLATLVSISR